MPPLLQDEQLPKKKAELPAEEIFKEPELLEKSELPQETELSRGPELPATKKYQHPLLSKGKFSIHDAAATTTTTNCSCPTLSDVALLNFYIPYSTQVHQITATITDY